MTLVVVVGELVGLMKNWLKQESNLLTFTSALPTEFSSQTVLGSASPNCATGTYIKSESMKHIYDV